MQKHILHSAIAIGVAALAVGCGGRTASVNMSQERATSAANASQNQRMELIGCVSPAPNAGEGKYILDHVVPPPGALVPEVNTSTNEPLIPRGSSVRLAGVDMKPYVGKQVLVSADLVGAGQPTIGTSGSKASPPPAGDMKADMPKGSVANGDMPELAVESVKVQTGTCSETK